MGIPCHVGECCPQKVWHVTEKYRKMKRFEELRENLLYTLELEEGSLPPTDSYGNREFEEVLVASEMKPYSLGKQWEGDVDNGESTCIDVYVVYQQDHYLVIEQVEHAHNYGCEYGKDGIEKDVVAYEVPTIEERHKQLYTQAETE